MYTMGIHFIESVTAVDYTSLRNRIETGEVSLTSARFKTTIRGWGNKTHQLHALSLLTMKKDRMVAKLQEERHIMLIPRKWCPEKTHTLEPQERTG